jgi:hypothetical protein
MFKSPATIDCEDVINPILHQVYYQVPNLFNPLFIDFRQSPTPGLWRESGRREIKFALNSAMHPHFGNPAMAKTMHQK